MHAALKELLQMFNNLTGNYQRRVRSSLIGTADAILPIIYKPILKKIRNKKRLTKAEKKIRHYCRQYKSNRKKLK